VASAEMADVAYVTGKAGLKIDSIRINFDENLEVSDLWLDLDARKVFQAAESDVVVQRLQLDVIALRQQIRLCCFKEVNQFLVGIRKVLGHRLLAVPWSH